MLREMYIGYIMSRSMLFYPEYPQADPANLPQQLFLLGYNLKVQPMREDGSKLITTNGRLSKLLRILFNLLQHPSSIGRLLVYLKELVAFRVH